MDGVSLSLAVVGTVSGCVASLKLLSRKYKSYQAAEGKISEIVLALDGHALKIEYQCGILHSIWDQLDGRLQMHQNQVLLVLKNKLQAAVDKTNTLLPDGQPGADIDTLRHYHGKVKKVKYDDYGNVKEIKYVDQGDVKKIKYTLVIASLKEVMDDVEQWQRTFDPTWFLIARMATPQVDQELTTQTPEENASQAIDAQKKVKWLRNVHILNRSGSASETSVFIPSRRLQENRDVIPFTTLSLTKSQTGKTDLIIDTRKLRGEDARLVERDIREFAMTVREAEPDFGLLKCYGVIRVMQTPTIEPCFELAFEVPKGLSQPKSLRNLLCSTQREHHSINERLHIAKLLARSVMSIHTAEFVHKNISPESIVVFEKTGSSAKLYTPFLLGFETFRHTNAMTFHKGDNLWEKNLYRHPSRQGVKVEEDFIMQHDMYSLGVCLLEIGLWSPFVRYESADTSQVGSLLEAFGLLGIKERKIRAVATQEGLVKITVELLPANMGKIYTEVVLACLTCLDKDNVMFGDEAEFEDEDGVQVAVRYAEKILLRLESISV